MTSLVATSANELTATFASAVADTSAITIKVNKAGSTTAITGTTKWSEDAKTLVFTATAKLTAGTYEMTATDSADATKTTSKTAVVENEKVDKIVISNEVALTSTDKKTAYIYYDVFNQYNESIRTSTNITWTVSSDQTPKVNKATGRISATRSDGKDYTYGEFLYVTGVYAKTGVTVQKQLSIGMEQNLDTVKTFGFVKATDKNKILESLPNNFQKGQYVMIYQVFDQNGNQVDAKGTELNDNSVTFISDNVLLLTNDFEDDGIYTIDGVEYSAVKVEPGQYVDKGGEVNITAISNKTGTKTVMNYVIGANALLKSVSLSQPATVVADGESATIPYVAYDTNGNQITNYESIARSTNTLSLTSSEGTLVVKEANDGTAVFEWTDKTVNYTDAVAKDGIDRTIALTTVVVGGDSTNFLLAVSDKARPSAVKSVDLGSGRTTALVEDDNDTLELADFTFVDQYGRTMGSENNLASNARTFFDTFNTSGTDFDGNYYAVRAEYNKVASCITRTTNAGSPIVTGNAIMLPASTAKVQWQANTSSPSAIKSETVKYAVVCIDKNASTAKKADPAEYDYVDKALNISYDIVPITSVTSISIDTPNKQYVSLGLEDYKTAAEAGGVATDLKEDLDTGFASAPSEYNVQIKAAYQQTLKTSGSYKGVKVVVPASYVVWDSNKLEFTNAKVTGVSNAAIKLGDFFDATTANLNRKDGSADVWAQVYTTTGAAASVSTATADKFAKPSVKVAFSDEAPKPATVKAPETATIQATNVAVSNAVLTQHGIDADGKNTTGALPEVKDQYNVTLSSGLTWTFTVSDLVENAGEFAHLDNSLAVKSNSTNNTSLADAELGDTLTLTFNVSNSYGSASAATKMTLGADTEANISSADTTPDDKNFRTKFLHYAY